MSNFVKFTRSQIKCKLIFVEGVLVPFKIEKKYQNIFVKIFFISTGDTVTRYASKTEELRD